jgi:hypothetical protein
MKKSKNMVQKKRLVDVQGEMNNHLTTIRGLVIPVEWDEDGNIRNLAISTYDEDEYWIEMDQRIKQLMSIVRKKVEVTGLVGETDGRKIIIVKRIDTNPS